MRSVVVQSELGGYRTSINARDHVVIADEPIDDGGLNAGPTPTELLAGALGACIVITCQLYAQRKKWPLEGVSVNIQFERINAADYPNYQGSAPFVHQFHEQIEFKGALTVEQRERLLQIAGKCPVRAILANPVFFSETLVEAQSGGEIPI